MLLLAVGVLFTACSSSSSSSPAAPSDPLPVAAQCPALEGLSNCTFQLDGDVDGGPCATSSAAFALNESTAAYNTSGGGVCTQALTDCVLRRVCNASLDAAAASILDVQFFADADGGSLTAVGSIIDPECAYNVLGAVCH
jgi:hypothetical protein